MDLIVLAGAALLVGVIFGSLALRAVGGWVHVYRARHGRGDPGKPTWDEMPNAFKIYYFTVPLYLAFAILATIGGVILIWR